MTWLKKKYGDKLNKNLSPETKKEIAQLYEMDLECKMIYTGGQSSKEGQMPVVNVNDIDAIPEPVSKLLIDSGILTSEDILNQGAEGLVAINGIGQKTAYTILKVINDFTTPGPSNDRKLMVINFGYPQGAYTEDTEFVGILTRAKNGDILTDTRQYHTEKANSPHTSDDPADDPNAECYIVCRTIKDWDLYKIHCQQFAVTRNNKTRKIIKQCGIVDTRITVTAFIEWSGWESGTLQGEPMPDTTPKSLTGTKTQEFDLMKAKLKTGAVEGAGAGK